MRKRWTAGVMSVALVVLMAGAALAADAEESDESTDLSDAQLMRAAQLAEDFAPAEEGFEPTEEDITALFETISTLRHGEDGSAGWGVIYKLLLLSEYNDMSLGDYADTFDSGWGFGKIFKELKDTDPEWSGDRPKNLGQWKKSHKDSDG